MTLLLLAACAGLFDGGKIDETCEDLPVGCEGGGADAGADTGGDLDLAIDSLDPVYGLIEGGTSVTITGGPFAADAVVSFGDTPARLRSWTETELLVETPAVSDDGWTSVTVETSQGSGTADRAFRYFRDGTGFTGLVGFVQYRHSVGSLASQGDRATAILQFLEPTTQDGWWVRFASGLGNCHRDYDPSLGWEPIDPGASTLPLTSSGGSGLSLAWDTAEQAYNGVDGTGEVPADVVQPGTRWTIDSFGGTELPTFSLDQLAEVPEAFEVTTPDIDSPSTTTMKEEEIDFRWASDGTADAVFLDLTLADGGTGEQLERITCLTEDTGSFSPPAGAFQQWDAGLVLYVKVGLLKETVVQLPLDGSDVRVLGAYTISGAATTEL